MTSSIFNFGAPVANREDSLFVVVPAELATRASLLEVLGRHLRFPSYYGKNWDALEECINDLSWLNERIVVIQHTRLPRRIPEHHLQTYLAILGDAVVSWRTRPEHDLIVCFASEDQEAVANLTANPDS